MDWSIQLKPCHQCGSLVLVDPISVPYCEPCYAAAEAERRAGAVCIGCGEAGTIEFGYCIFVCETCSPEADKWGIEGDETEGWRIRPRRRRRCLVCRDLSFTPRNFCDDCLPRVEACGAWSLVRQEHVPAGSFRCLYCDVIQPLAAFRGSQSGYCDECRSRWYD